MIDLGFWNGAGCVVCPISPGQKKMFIDTDPQGTLAIVVYQGNSLCYKHFQEARDE